MLQDELSFCVLCEALSCVVGPSVARRPAGLVFSSCSTHEQCFSAPQPSGDTAGKRQRRRLSSVPWLKFRAQRLSEALPLCPEVKSCAGSCVAVVLIEKLVRAPSSTHRQNWSDCFCAVNKDANSKPSTQSSQVFVWSTAADVCLCRVISGQSYT